jgi:protein TonB
LAIYHDPSALADAEPHRAPRGLAVLWASAWDSARRRKAASLAIALLLEALIVLLLITLGARIAGDPEGKEVVTEFKAVEFAAPPEPEPEPATDAPPETSEVTPQDQPLPTPDPPRPSPLLLNPAPAPEPPPPAPPPPQPEPKPSPSPSPKIAAKINPGRSYGPVDTGNPRTAGDSQRVGTAPNGEPLYAARWYREPTDKELSGYLSTANGPGSALIACKTVPDYYVEDCVFLGETPPGSQIGRAVMAAAWQFRVRPARIGGREQFGSWVRIRIDYTVRRAPP